MLNGNNPSAAVYTRPITTVNKFTHAPAAGQLAGYTALDKLAFPEMLPQQVGVSTAIPNNTQGSTRLRGYDKTPDNNSPWAKLVIKSQLMKV